MFAKLVFSFFTLATSSAAQTQGPPIDGITFAEKPADVYISARSFADGLGMPMAYDSKSNHLLIQGKPVPSGRKLFDGTRLVSVEDLKAVNAQVQWADDKKSLELNVDGKQIQVRLGDKKVTIDLGTQQLDAFQGSLLVFSSHVSTGKEGKRTPPGTYKVGPKSKMHYSKLYNNAPMPWSVQVNGNIFIHGFKSVPKHPASHGCIRMPVGAAHWFYRWVDQGTPISIVGEWISKPAATPKPPAPQVP